MKNENNSNSKDIKIVRFLSLEEARYVLKNPSEFCLNSLWYYREIEEEGIGDDQELRIESINKESKEEGELLNNFLVSCWTILENNKIKDEDWQIFPCKNDLAIVSTVEKVDKFLKEKCEIFLNHEIFMDYQHQKVIYYDTVDKITSIFKNLKLKEEGMIDKIPCGKDNQRMKLLLYAPFLKHKDFGNQREYRFVFRVRNDLYLKSLILYNNFIYRDDLAPEYIDEIIPNPKLNDGKRKIIESMCIEANLISKLKCSS